VEALWWGCGAWGRLFGSAVPWVVMWTWRAYVVGTKASRCCHGCINRKRDERESDARYSLAPIRRRQSGAHVADVGQSSQDTVTSNLPHQKCGRNSALTPYLLHRLAYRLILFTSMFPTTLTPDLPQTGWLERYTLYTCTTGSSCV